MHSKAQQKCGLYPRNISTVKLFLRKSNLKYYFYIKTARDKLQSIIKRVFFFKDKTQELKEILILYSHFMGIRKFSVVPTREQSCSLGLRSPG